MNAPDKAKATAMKPLPEDPNILIPMRNTVLLPGVTSPIHANLDRMIKMEKGDF